MRLFSFLILLLGLLGCTTLSGRKTTSGWYVLQKAADVKCASWPAREADLELDEVAAVAGKAPGFLVTGLSRNASPMHYYVPFSNEPEIDLDLLQPLTLGRGAVILGGALQGGKAYVMVARNIHGDSPDKALLEVRTAADNVISYKADLGAFNVVEGTTAQSMGGTWLVFKDEDNVYHVSFLRFEKSGQVALSLLKGLVFKDRPQLIATPARPGALIVWRDGETGRPFHAQSLTETGVTASPVALPIDVASQVESWTTYGSTQGSYLAFIDGDSLIGQAELKISYFNGLDSKGEVDANVKWTRASLLKDIHATDPVFLQTPKGLEILLLNWIDEESTIARYMVAGGVVGKPGYAGVFPKGSRIIEAISADAEPYVVVRYRNDTRWAFEVCAL